MLNSNKATKQTNTFNDYKTDYLLIMNHLPAVAIIRKYDNMKAPLPQLINWNKAIIIEITPYKGINMFSTQI